jgi:predicted metal-binding protein
MEGGKKDLEKLRLNAVKYGASKAAIIPARNVVVDPRVRLKCMIPVCAGYGVNLMCPPNVMTPEEFSRVLSRYDHAMLLQSRIKTDREFMDLVRTDKPLSEVRMEKKYFDTLAKSGRDLVDLLCKLESDALKLGYRFATGLSGGPWRICDKCVGQKSGNPCRHPFMARPAMEAVGIDVVETARKAGMPFEFPADKNPTWTALLLVD